MAGTILQQSFVVEYVVNHQMCDDCRRVEAKDTWNANVRINKYCFYIFDLGFRYEDRLACPTFMGSCTDIPIVTIQSTLV